MGKRPRKRGRKRRSGDVGGGKKVGSTKQPCADPRTGLVVIVRNKVTRKPIGKATVKVAGLTPGARETGPRGHASWFPVAPIKYTIHVTLDPEMAPRFEPVAAVTTTVLKGYSWNKTVYVVPLAGLRVKVVVRKPRAGQAGQQQAAQESLKGVVVRVAELGTTKATDFPDGWADFGVVKRGRYTASVEMWGPHGDKYQLVGGVGKQGTVLSGRVTDIVLEAVAAGWIEFKVVYDKPKEGQKAEIEVATLTVKVPGNRTGPHTTRATGVARIEELDPGTCDVEAMTYVGADLEVVSG